MCIRDRSTTQSVLFSVFSGEGSALVVRKVGASLKNTVYEEFKKMCIRDSLRISLSDVCAIPIFSAKDLLLLYPN